MMAIKGGVEIPTSSIVSYYNFDKIQGNQVMDKIGNHHLTGIQNFSASNKGKTKLRSWMEFNQTVVDFREIIPTTFSLVLSFRAHTVSGTQSIMGETNFISVQIINGTLRARLTQSGSPSVPSLTKTGIQANTWYTVHIVVPTQGGDFQMYVDSPFNPLTTTMPYTLAHSNGDCVLGAGNLGATDYFDGDLSSVVVYNGAVYPSEQSFTSYGKSIKNQLTLPAQLVPDVTIASGPAWDIDDVVLAYDMTDPAGFTGTELINLAPGASTGNMGVVGGPTLEDSKWLNFQPGMYAEGIYDEFVNLYPNSALGTDTRDFTVLLMFTNESTANVLGGFDFGFDSNTAIAWQQYAGNVITTDISSGGSINFNYRENHEYFVGDGSSVDASQEQNYYVNKVGMQGLRFTYQGSGDSYLVEWVLDGKRASLWNPPSWRTTSEVVNIDWNWHTSGWAKRKPVINAITTTGTPNAGGRHIKFGGMFMFNRAITDAEIAAIYQAFE